VALRLHEDKERSLKSTPGAVAVLAKQLAHTYHYYLHPAHAAAHAAHRGPGDGGTQGVTQGATQGASSSSSEVAVLAVSVEVIARGHASRATQRGLEFGWEREQRLSLGEGPDLEGLYRDKGSESVFRFAMDVEHQDDGGRAMTHAVHGEVTEIRRTHAFAVCGWVWVRVFFC
jgi:hypothetical protein